WRLPAPNPSANPVGYTRKGGKRLLPPTEPGRLRQRSTASPEAIRSHASCAAASRTYRVRPRTLEEEDIVRHTRNGSSNGASTGDADPGTRIVVRFCEKLRHLPLGVWAEASDRVERADNLARAARARLRQTVDRMPRARGHVTPRVNELVSVAEG